MGNPAEPGGNPVPEGAIATAHQQAAASAGNPGPAAPAVAGHSGPYPTFHGRLVSWVAVSIVTVGFLVGGAALVFGTGGTIWWLFWTGCGLTVLGLLLALATNTFEDWY